VNTAQETYQMHEGTLAIPEEFQDRTANLFVKVHSENSPTLSVARDRAEEDESLPDYVTRQVKVLEEKIPELALQGRTVASLGTGARVILGEQIESQFRSGGRKLYQRQAAFLLPKRRVLIFTATLTSPPYSAFEALWAKWLESFVPHSAE
jgi:hypothetical protein